MAEQVTEVTETVDITPEAAPTPPTQPEPQVDIEALIAENQKLKSKNDTLLGEKKKVQTKLQDHEGKFQEVISGLAKLVGLESGEEEPDPRQLTSQIANLQQTIDVQDVEKRAIVAAYQAGVDPGLAVPVLKSEGKLNLSLNDPDFEVALEAAIGGFVEKYPTLVSGAPVEKPKAVPPTPSGAGNVVSLDAQWAQVRESGDSKAIAEFWDNHAGSILGDTGTV